MLLKTRFFILATTTIVAACGNSSDIENTIKAKIKYPDSAKFQRILVNESKTRACAIWNAKNDVGIYGDWEVTSLKKASGQWQIADLKLDPKRCTEEFFKLHDEFLRLSEKVSRMNDAPEKLRQIAKESRDFDHTPPELLKSLVELMRTVVK